MRRLKKRKRIEAQWVKHPLLPQATNALIGDEEQNVKKEQKEGNRESPQPSYPIPFSHLLPRAWIIR